MVPLSTSLRVVLQRCQVVSGIWVTATVPTTSITRMVPTSLAGDRRVMVAGMMSKATIMAIRAPREAVSPMASTPRGRYPRQSQRMRGLPEGHGEICRHGQRERESHPQIVRVEALSGKPSGCLVGVQPLPVIHEGIECRDVGTADVGESSPPLALDRGSQLPDHPEHQQQLEIGHELSDSPGLVDGTKHSQPGQDYEQQQPECGRSGSAAPVR